MKRISRTLVLVLAMLMVLQPVLSLAGTGARVIPQGKVSILEEGKEVTQFQSELPLPEGTMMLCNGNCVGANPKPPAGRSRSGGVCSGRRQSALGFDRQVGAGGLRYAP